MPSYRIEQAPSNRAGCQNKECKDQKIKIKKGELRLGSWVDTPNFQSFFWRHWGCVTPKVISNVSEVVGEGDDMDMDMLDGYDELPSDLQEKVVKAIENGHVDTEDWKGDPEMNEPGMNGFRVKTPKKGKKDADEEQKKDASDKEENPKAAKNTQKGRAAKDQKKEDASGDEEETQAPNTKKRTRLQIEDDDHDAETSKRPRRKPTGYPKDVPPPSDSEDEDESSGDASDSPPPKRRARRASKPAAKPAAKRGRKKAEAADEDAEAAPAAEKPKRGRRKAT